MSVGAVERSHHDVRNRTRKIKMRIVKPRSFSIKVNRPFDPPARIKRHANAIGEIVFSSCVVFNANRVPLSNNTPRKFRVERQFIGQLFRIDNFRFKSTTIRSPEKSSGRRVRSFRKSLHAGLNNRFRIIQSEKFYAQLEQKEKVLAPVVSFKKVQRVLAGVHRVMRLVKNNCLRRWAAHFPSFTFSFSGLFLSSFGERESTAAHANQVTFIQSGFAYCLPVHISSIATAVIFNPPTIFIGVNPRVHTRTLWIVEDDSAFPVAAQEIVFGRN